MLLLYLETKFQVIVLCFESYYILKIINLNNKHGVLSQTYLRQHDVMERVLKSERLEFKFQLSHLGVMWPWESSLILWTCFFRCQMEAVSSPSSGFFVSKTCHSVKCSITEYQLSLKINEIMCKWCKIFSLVLHGNYTFRESFHEWASVVAHSFN